MGALSLSVRSATIVGTMDLSYQLEQLHGDLAAMDAGLMTTRPVFAAFCALLDAADKEHPVVAAISKAVEGMPSNERRLNAGPMMLLVGQLLVASKAP